MFSSTLIKFQKSWIGTRSMTINNKVNFFFGKSDRWGVEVSYTHYDRAFNILVLHWYLGFEVWYSE